MTFLEKEFHIQEADAPFKGIEGRRNLRGLLLGQGPNAFVQKSSLALGRTKCNAGTIKMQMLEINLKRFLLGLKPN